MLGSQSRWFHKDPEELKIKRLEIITLLKIKGYRSDQIEIYLKAYDYFCVNPDSYDGATIVKDLCDIPRLDLDAMLHDFHYIVYNVSKSFKTKFLADWIYAKGQESKGKGSYSSFSRFLGLTIVGLFFVPYTVLKKRNKNIDSMINEDYKILTQK